MNITTTREYVDNPIVLEVLDEKGLLVSHQLMFNSRTQAGGIAVCTSQFASAGIAFKYVALSSNAGLSPANGDVVLSTEIASGGLSRVLGSVVIGSTQTALNGTVAVIITATWSVTASYTIYGAGLLSQPTGGVLGYEATCSATPVANGYTVNLTWTLNE